jgi:hypothetical protein
MDIDIQKMLKALVKGQAELSNKIDGVYSGLSLEIYELNKKVDSLTKETHKGSKEVNGRIDKLGKSLACLEDDAPTREEFDNLETKATKVEQTLAVA